MTARAVTIADAQRLAALHGQAFDAPWSAQAIADLLANGAFGYAVEDGFILCREGGGELEILTLAVAPQARRRGTGRLLVEIAAQGSAEHGAAVLFLEVAADNDAAKALYRAAGFEQAGIRRSYYSRDTQMIDALILSRALNRP